MNLKNVGLFVVFFILLVFACKKDDPDPVVEAMPITDPVNVDLDSIPYQNLADYNFFDGDIKDQIPTARVLDYDLISPLFTDYAHKKRFVWMPEGTSATYATDGSVLNFPDGTVLIKTFYYDNMLPDNVTRIIETRLMIKQTDEWIFADYVWNEDQSEAIYSLDGSNVPINWIDDNNVERSTTYRIPSSSECLNCHKVTAQEIPIPIGPKPQNLNKDIEGVNQLARWVSNGYLASYPENINTVVAWDDESESISDRARSYVDVNCAHCHREGSHCSYRSMRFAYSETVNIENMGVCIEPGLVDIGSQYSHIITSGNVDRSALHYRLSTNAPEERMPLLGRTIVHEEGLALMEDYINSLPTPCP